jgi:hypothetical protein
MAWFAIGLDAAFGYSDSWLKSLCGDSGMSCGIVSGTVSPLLVLAFATTIFLFFPYGRISRKVRRRAKKDPRSYVPTAGTVLEDVVGRGELCQVITRALHDRAIRRPYLLVGSVGTGKTAVLVQLTRMLAEKGAVPVPIRLRDIDQGGARFDFAEAGRKRFREMVDSQLVSGGHGERAWRQLVADGKAVVIADGLEELFGQGPHQKERDIAIRKAIRRAKLQRLPLVIASRPHPPLEEADAAIIDLEPLSEEAALEYLSESCPVPDGLRLDWIVETAVVSEAPLYLQITRRLRQHHRLEYLTRSKEWEDLDTRAADRSTLRLRLLDTWKNALIKGNLYEDYALSSEPRANTVEVISALACIGLLEDSLEVNFSQLINPTEEPGNRPGRHSVTSSISFPYRRLSRTWQRASSPPTRADKFPEIWSALKRRLAWPEQGTIPMPPGSDISDCLNHLSLYATHAENLGLVETIGYGVRFHHSLIQAYLGARFLNEVSDKHLEAALREPKPGRELLTALVLNSRMPKPGRHFRAHKAYRRNPTAQLLLRTAKSRWDAKAFDIYATALEIDRMEEKSGKDLHRAIASSTLHNWSRITIGDQRSINEAKENLVRRFGETVRAIDKEGRDSSDTSSGKKPAYEQLLDIALREPLYQVRLAVTQELGASGDGTFDVLRTRFPLSENGRPPSDYDPWEQYKEKYRKVKIKENEAFEQLRREKIANCETTYAKYRELEHEYREKKNEIRREYATRAWLVPMMVGSVTEKYQQQAKERVELWLKHLDHTRLDTKGAELPIILEIALAQGFKFAANRRRRHPNNNEETREFMVQQAEILLARARYWYSHLTLIHALCLWELPDSPGKSPAGCWDPPKLDASQAVTRWLGIAGNQRDPRSRKPGDFTSDGRERLHPFVAEAAELAALALETGHPERYLWIDEKGAMDGVGSTPAHPSDYRRHNLWIPPSVGWSTLHPRAQQLLADVLLLLNLAERDGDPDKVDGRLEKANRTDLPPCLTKGREPLRPDRTVGMADDAAPGSTCLRNCPFEMCPYPAKGQQARAELQETFCRQQQALVRNPILRHRAPWQDMTRKELTRFWGTMARRSRIRAE